MRPIHGVGVGAVIVAAAGWFLLGISPVAEPAPPAPAGDHAEAIALADSICGCVGAPVNPECRTRIIAPDPAVASAGATAPVVLLLHGFTNCPKQFDRLARELSQRGFRVVVPLLPRHGRSDRMTTELGRLSAEELVRAGDQALDVARGLGRPVTVVGLSSSAVLAGWLAQHRDGVDCAVLLAPALGPKGMPAAFVRPLTGALLRLPNFYVWWDSKLRAGVPGPRQCYPRFASRAIAQVYRLGTALLDDAKRERPKARRIVVVTTVEDDAVNNGLCAELGRRWRERGARVETFQFPAALAVHHDMIDPEQPYQRVASVYPVLENLIAPSMAAAPPHSP